MNIKQFKKKWGTRGTSLMVNRFIERAPKFKDEAPLAKIIYEILDDLEKALESVKD